MQKLLFLVYRHFECFKQLVCGGADLCLPPAVSNVESPLPLVKAVLRYGCELKYLKLLVLSGGIKNFKDIDGVLLQFHDNAYVTSRAKQECKTYLETLQSKLRASIVS